MFKLGAVCALSQLLGKTSDILEACMPWKAAGHRNHSDSNLKCLRHLAYSGRKSQSSRTWIFSADEKLYGLLIILLHLMHYYF